MFWMTIPWFCAAAAAAAGICYLVRGLLGERVSLSPKYNKNAPPPKGLALPLLALSAVFAGLALSAGYIGYTTNDIVGTSTVDPAVHGGATGAACVAIGLLTWAIIGDRAKGRRRCPKCWHDLAETERLHKQGRIPALTCPECGHNLIAPKALAKTRRPKWAVSTSMVILAVSALLATGGPSTKQHGWRGAIPMPLLVYAWPWLPDEWVLDGYKGSLATRLRDDRPAWLDRIYGNQLSASVETTLLTSNDLNQGLRASNILDSLWSLPTHPPADPFTGTPPLAERFVRSFLDDPNDPYFKHLMQIAGSTVQTHSARYRSTPLVTLNDDDAARYATKLLSITGGLGNYSWPAMHLAAWDNPAAIDVYLTHKGPLNEARITDLALYTLAWTTARSEKGRQHLIDATKSEDLKIMLNAILVLLVEAHDSNRYFDRHKHEERAAEIRTFTRQLIEYLRNAEAEGAFVAELDNATAILSHVARASPDVPEALVDAAIPWIVNTNGRDDDLIGPLLWHHREPSFANRLQRMMNLVPELDQAGSMELASAIEQAILFQGTDHWRPLLERNIEQTQTILNRTTDASLRQLLKQTVPSLRTEGQPTQPIEPQP